MSLKKVSAKPSADKKKKLITIVAEGNHKKIWQRCACSGISTPVELKHVNDLYFFVLKTHKKRTFWVLFSG